MGWLRKKKQVDSEKEDEHSMLTKEQIEEIDKVLEKHEHSEKTPEEEKLIYKKRLISGESELSAKSDLQTFTEKKVNEKLIRPTRHECPECSTTLYNTKLDGLHYYCPLCNRRCQVKSFK